MRLVIVAVGTRMPGWVDAGFADYAKRMPRELRVELIEVRPEPRDRGKPVDALLAAEARRMEACVAPLACRVALDERGREFSTSALAQWLRERSGDGRDIAFLIGGPDGLAGEVKERAALRLRLSAMTLPHALARVVLAEQLYRCACILRNHPYHRE
jgi:23S rRNA (pseudouridine1915-N3)-methyltransferase